MKRFIAFDIDGTLFRLALLNHVLERMIEHGSIPPTTLKEIRRVEALWRSRQISYDDYLTPIIRALEEWLGQRHPRALFEALAHEALSTHLEEVHVFTRSLLRAAQGCDYATMAISYSPNESARLFSEYWKFTHVRGSLSEVDAEGRYTGTRVLGEKPRVLQRFVDSHDYTRVDSIGVGDTLSDAEMIADTAHPIAFNPSAELLARARELPHCLMVQERKNVCTVIGFEHGTPIRLDAHWRSPNGTRFLADDLLPPLREELQKAGYQLLTL